MYHVNAQGVDERMTNVHYYSFQGMFLHDTFINKWVHFTAFSTVLWLFLAAESC